MFTINKEFSFSASHQLTGLPSTHKCSRLHGHNYIVSVTLRSADVNSDGFVIDYGELSPLKDYLDGKLDHRHLNDIFTFSPTAENLAKHIYQICRELWPQVIAVRVSETEKTWSEYAE